MEMYSLFIPANTTLVKDFIKMMTLSDCALFKDYTITITDQKIVRIDTITCSKQTVVRDAVSKIIMKESTLEKSI